VTILAPPLKPTASLVLSVLAWAMATGSIRGSEAWIDQPSRPHDMLGTLSCSSVSCHGQPEPQVSSASYGQAYHQWLSGDPHGQAGLRTLQPGFQEMLKRASQRPDGGVDPRVYAQCAKCHDPVGTGESKAGASPSQFITRGIGCESCHGPAREWISKHYERDISREQLRELGMVDTKNVLVRARLCASCHVGSAENDVTHDMLAAGHPPLRFEMASHQALIARKHWDDSVRRHAQPDHEVQLWAAGRLASAEAALSLLEGRAKRAATDETRTGTDRKGAWPELAEYNCFACHQSLRPEVGKLTLDSVAGRVSGMPAWQRWNVECVTTRSAELDKTLAQLRSEMEKSYFPQAENVARFAADARAALRGATRINEGAVLDAAGRPLGIPAALNVLADRHGGFTWERACHELAVLAAVERSLGNRNLISALQHNTFREHASRVGRSLAFSDSRFEWPEVFDGSRPGPLQPGSTMPLDQIADELNSMSTELRQAWHRTEY